jgi:hypothetical protein
VCSFYLENAKKNFFLFIYFSSLFICTTGTVLLDLDEQKLECIYEAMINDAIANGQMNKDVKDELLRLLTSNHQYEQNWFFFYLIID